MTTTAMTTNEAPAQAVATSAGNSLAPRTIDEAMRLADMLADSDLVPKDYRGKPGNVFVAMQWGAEIGLKPLQALQNIAVINGRPSLWGDATLALVRSSPLCEYVIETMDAAGTAFCQVKRRGEPEQTRSFSEADAKTARLHGKEGPWQTAPRRMRQMRARAFALRDVFPDVLKGLPIAEEVIDIEPSTPGPTPGEAPVVVPPELMVAARAAAADGVASYAAWWKDCTKADRQLLQHEHPALKIKAEEADASMAAKVDPETGEIGDGAETALGDAMGAEAGST